MRVFNAHEPRLVRETSARIDSVHKCVQARRNAADLYKQSDPHCRTCMQRGIFARFFVLTVSACLLALPLYPFVPLFPIYSISEFLRFLPFLRFSSRIIGRITLYIFVNLKFKSNFNETIEKATNLIRQDRIEFFIGLQGNSSKDESWRAASNRLEIHTYIYVYIRIVYYSLWNTGKSYSGRGRNSIVGWEKGVGCGTSGIMFITPRFDGIRNLFLYRL